MLRIYRATIPFTLTAAGTFGATARVMPTCEPGDRATGGGYFVNGGGSPDVRVFSNSPNTDYDNPSPPGWDIGIRNHTTGQITGFAFAVCADMTP